MKVLSKEQMKNVMGGKGTPSCANSGTVCTANSECCSKSCGEKDKDGKRYCDGAASATL